ncbi:MAG: hypothetical protein RBR50_04020 [Candidatus Izemoplasmatales bacterium]|nr:hypothetical protein [Candidatus Izemoplasmatales bacterium]
MKREGTRIILVLLFFLIFGGIGAFIQGIEVIVRGIGLGIFVVFKLLPHLPTSFYDLVASGVTENWQLTNIVWIDTLLVNIAVFVPSIIIFIIGLIGIKKIHPSISFMISVLVLFAVLELFSSVIFWIILGIFIIFVIGLSVYLRYLSSREEECIIKEAKEIPFQEEKLNEIKEQIIIETNRFHSLYDLWKLNGYRPFKAFNSVNNTYVYISTNPLSQYDKYGKVYGRLSYDQDTYKHGKNCEIYYAAKPIWELA